MIAGLIAVAVLTIAFAVIVGGWAWVKADTRRSAAAAIVWRNEIRAAAAIA